VVADKNRNRLGGEDPTALGEYAGKMTPEKYFKKWTPKQDERLRELLDAGLSHFSVAAKLRRSVSSLRGRAVVLGISVGLRKVPLTRG
jgi:hypothetical protein